MTQPELVVIESLQGMQELYTCLQGHEFIAYDCETTGLIPGQDEVIGFSVCAEESKAYYCILARWNKDTKAIDYDRVMIDYTAEMLTLLTTKALLMHNAVFDCSMAEHYFKIRLIEALHTDTMLLAHLVNENRRVGLKELSRELFGESSIDEQVEMQASVLANGGEYTSKNKELYKADAYVLAKYGAKDAWLTFMLFHKLLPELVAQGLDKFFYEDESMPLLKGPTYELNTTGLQVNSQKLMALKQQLEAECAQAQDFIYKEIDSYVKAKYPATKKTNRFNIGSSSQLSWLLFGQLKLEFATLTREGKTVCKALGLRLPYAYGAKQEFIATCESAKGQIYQPEVKTLTKTIRAKKVRDPWGYIACDKKTLVKLAPRYKWIQSLLDYQRKTKLLNTYVDGIQERTRYGVIHPSFLQHVVPSGRYSSKNPNFQNLPRDDKRIKDCIQARPGKKYVGADFSQLEPRVFAYYSQDERLKAVFDGTDDFYSVIGMEVYEKYDCIPQKEGSTNAFGIRYTSLRNASKVIALAATYGATPAQLAPTTGKSINDTHEDIEAYFRAFPGVRQYQLDYHESAKRTGGVHNLFGRPRRIPEAKRITKLYGNVAHADLPYEARSLLNLAVNFPIQSTGASIVNRSAIKFKANCKQAHIDCRLVLQVHDSLVVECDEKDAEDVAVLLQDAMENAVVLEGVRLEAVPKIGNTLAEV